MSHFSTFPIPQQVSYLHNDLPHFLRRVRLVRYRNQPSNVSGIKRQIVIHLTHEFRVIDRNSLEAILGSEIRVDIRGRCVGSSGVCLYGSC